MSVIIEKIYEQIFAEDVFKADRHYQRRMEKQLEASETLISSLSPEQRKLFETYCEQVSRTDSYIHQCLFCRGFKTGIRIILECI